MGRLGQGGVVIAGERSGVGKTTVTLALLAALAQTSRRVQSFKVGPDYIDPMFHRRVTGRPCYNLDPVITSEDYVRQCFGEQCRDADFALVEGVMGLFDGATGISDTASTAQIAKLLNLPVVLVVDCSRLSRSVLAIVHGYRSLDPDLTLAGVVLNRVGSDRHLELLQGALKTAEVPILGVLRRQREITIPDRHLGLVPTAELPQLQDYLDRLAHLGQTGFDWDCLRPLLTVDRAQATLPPPPPIPAAPDPSPGGWAVPGDPIHRLRPRLAVAQDAAFSFYYADGLDYLRELGAELVPWSPLVDRTLPEATDGLYLGGGFPEMFGAELAENQPLRQHLRQRITAGLPTYAECGGLMYLAETLIDLQGQPWPMVGVLPTAVTMQSRLTLGYRQATATLDSVALQAQQRVWGHEFHHSQVTMPPAAPLFQLRRFDAQSPHTTEGWAVHQVHASYVHLHWQGCKAQAAQFLSACAQYRAAGAGPSTSN
ncbi:MAG: cobyrinate a,c-diamide synthase [Leptolyngbya sp.]|nr:cobyrinate a,c-diamide synthase [Leptolyngbya sp.]